MRERERAERILHSPKPNHNQVEIKCMSNRWADTRSIPHINRCVPELVAYLDTNSETVFHNEIAIENGFVLIWIADGNNPEACAMSHVCVWLKIHNYCDECVTSALDTQHTHRRATHDGNKNFISQHLRAAYAQQSTMPDASNNTKQTILERNWDTNERVTINTCNRGVEMDVKHSPCAQRIFHLVQFVDWATRPSFECSKTIYFRQRKRSNLNVLLFIHTYRWLVCPTNCFNNWRSVNTRWCKRKRRRRCIIN